MSWEGETEGTVELEDRDRESVGNLEGGLTEEEEDITALLAAPLFVVDDVSAEILFVGKVPGGVVGLEPSLRGNFE